MSAEGPELETLLRRLAETPPDFLAEPGVVRVEAVAGDVLRDLGGTLTEKDAAAFRPSNTQADRNRLRLTLITCWLLHDPWFRRQPPLAAAAARFLLAELSELAASVSAEKCVSDPDRREELARVCLHHLGLRPAGESEAQATDRLTTISSSERRRVVAAARAAEARARHIREEMAKQAAREAELKAMRE